MMEIQGAIFDMDGTLTESMPMWRSLKARYIMELGLPVRDGIDAEIGNGGEALAQFLKSEYGIIKTASEVIEGRQRILTRFYHDEVTAKPGAQAYLDKLAKRGVKMCVVTQTHRALAAAGLERCGMLGYFGRVISCRDFGSGKDEPGIFEYALSLLGTEKEKTPVVEDAYYSAATAKAAGFPVIGVYDSCWPDTDRLRELADRYVVSLEELV